MLSVWSQVSSPRTIIYRITADQKRFESHCTAQYSVENTFSEAKHIDIFVDRKPLEQDV